jgi:hypothetical protein
MSDSDGIQISDRASWEHTGKELWAILGKRVIALPSKMLGFKPFCLYLATWLLIHGYISDWIWFAVTVMTLFGIVGLKVIRGISNREQGISNREQGASNKYKSRGGASEWVLEGGYDRGGGGFGAGGGSGGSAVFPGEGPEDV